MCINNYLRVYTRAKVIERINYFIAIRLYRNKQKTTIKRVKAMRINNYLRVHTRALGTDK